MEKPNLPQRLQELFQSDLTAKLIDLRRDLHRHPELSFKEERTCQQLYEALSELKPKMLEKVAATGVVARFAGQDPEAPIVALRGDIDALPIHEETGLPFSSENAGVMHACGHDVHATWAVGAAHLLARNPARGDVVVILQPGEETGQGAAQILESGALRGVSAIFGAHVDRRFEIGEVVAQEGPLAASSDTFEIELHGRGAHGARPHESADTIVGAAAVITALQTIVSRRLNPAYPGVVTVGKIHAGSAPNVIPGLAQLSGTIRAVDVETRQFLLNEVTEVARAEAAAHRLQADVFLHSGTPAIVNPPEPVAWARQAVVSVLGEAALKPLGFLNMGGEDFARYMEEMPGCFLRIGAREKGGETIPAHSPQFYAAEESIFIGAAVLAETARVASKTLAESKD